MEIVGKGEETTPKKQINIDISKQPDILCANCGGKYFKQVVSFKKVSKILTGAPTDQIAPLAVYICSDCNTPCEELMPKD